MSEADRGIVFFPGALDDVAHTSEFNDTRYRRVSDRSYQISKQ